MSIATEINRIQAAKEDIRYAIEAKGVTVPSGATIDTYDGYIDNISAGIALPQNVKSIVLNDDGRPQEIELSDDLTGITESMYEGERTLISVNIPSGVTEIGHYAFRGCGLTAITVPENVTYLGHSVFENCSQLNTAIINADIDYLNDDMFRNSALRSVTLPSGLTGIGGYAFWNCRILPSVNIPSGVTDIGNYAFQRCYALSSVTLPDALENIGNYAFDSCSALTSIDIPSGVTNIPLYLFANCTSLSSVTFHGDVEAIGNYAFSKCMELTGITLPDSLLTIGSNTFLQCSGLTSIVIPTGTTNIGSSTFEDCSNLELIDMYCDTVIARYAFRRVGTNTPSGATLVIRGDNTIVDGSLYSFSFTNALLKEMYVEDTVLADYRNDSAWLSAVGYDANNIKPLSDYVSV